LYLEDANSEKITTNKKTIFKKTAYLLQEGKIIAIKNTSGYLLCCNAEDENVIQKIKKVKKIVQINHLRYCILL